jgi:hypothetical protein
MRLNMKWGGMMDDYVITRELRRKGFDPYHSMSDRFVEREIEKGFRSPQSGFFGMRGKISLPDPHLHVTDLLLHEPRKTPLTVKSPKKAQMKVTLSSPRIHSKNPLKTIPEIQSPDLDNILNPLDIVIAEDIQRARSSNMQTKVAMRGDITKKLLKQVIRR